LSFVERIVSFGAGNMALGKVACAVDVEMEFVGGKWRGQVGIPPVKTMGTG
jgi:hypothetical protein